MKTNKIVAFAEDLLSFIMLEEGLLIRIKAVYLFGSAVRGTLTKKSDIDIFIDCKKEDEQEVNKKSYLALGKFLKSEEYKKWGFLGVSNPVSIHVGQLEEWDVKKSIYSEGLLLYGKPTPTDYSRSILLWLELPKSKKVYLKFTRELYGRKEYKKGNLSQKLRVEKISTKVMILPQESLSQVLNMLKKYEINYSFKEILIVNS